jgi:hypothetical protein
MQQAGLSGLPARKSFPKQIVNYRIALGGDSIEV